MAIGPSHQTDGGAEGEPRLDIRSPVIAGVGAFVVLVAAAAAAVSLVPVPQVVSLAGVVAERAERAEVIAPTAGTIATVHVGPDEVVEAGQLLVSLDNTAVKEEAAALKAQLGAAAKMLESARVEAVTAADLAERGAATEEALAHARTKAAEAEAEVGRLVARIKSAEQQLERSLVRAPSSGHVKAVDVMDGQQVVSGLKLLEIATDRGMLAVDACYPSGAAGLLAKGAVTAVKPAAPLVTSPLAAGGPATTGTAFTGRLAATVRPQAAGACATSVRVEIETLAAGALPAGTSVAVGIDLGKRTLVEQLGFLAKRQNLI